MYSTIDNLVRMSDGADTQMPDVTIQPSCIGFEGKKKSYFKIFFFHSVKLLKNLNIQYSRENQSTQTNYMYFKQRSDSQA